MQGNRLVSWTLAGAVALGLLTPTAAHAGKSGRRNTAIALGAVAAYGIVKKKPVIAGVGAAGAVYSFMRSQQSDPRRRKRRVRRVYTASRPVVHHHHYSGCGHAASGHTPPGWSRGKKVGWAKHGKHGR